MSTSLSAASRRNIETVLAARPDLSRSRLEELARIVERDRPGMVIAPSGFVGGPSQPMQGDAVSPPLWYMQFKALGRQPAPGTVEDGTYRFGSVTVTVTGGRAQLGEGQTQPPMSRDELQRLVDRSLGSGWTLVDEASSFPRDERVLIRLAKGSLVKAFLFNGERFEAAQG